jgi:hypothetical protein
MEIEKPPTPVEIEKVKMSEIECERAELLANLSDPDAGKNDEERREIVSGIYSLDAIQLTIGLT